MRNIGVYTYGGSGNHGCEALLRTLQYLIPKEPLTVYTQRPEDDANYLKQFPATFIKATQPPSIVEKVLNKIQGEYSRIRRYYMPTITGSKSQDVMISIGGDNYCYDNYRRVPGIIRKGFSSNTKSILLGCSIDESAVEQKDVLWDLESFDLITAREKITYNMLKSILKNTRVEYYPDSAFFLETDKEVILPAEGDFVGLNLSPMVMEAEKTGGTILDNTYEVLEYILGNTELNILLVPHVIWKGNDDRIVLNEIYKKYADSGRIYMVEDMNCCKLKGFISKCRFFIGARTHATIAAYSSCVPTIVLGYSVKSRGIAKDIFGTDQRYVLPVQDLTSGQLICEFKWLMENESQIRTHLNNIMPEYIKKAWEVRDALYSIIYN